MWALKANEIIEHNQDYTAIYVSEISHILEEIQHNFSRNKSNFSM